MWCEVRINTIIQHIKDKWSDIVTGVTNVRTSIGIVMEHSKPINLEKRLLKVGIHNQPKFSLDLLNNNKEVIEEIITNQLKEKVSIDFSEIHEHNEPIHTNDENVINVNSKEANSDPMGSVIELFDGEILR